MAGATCVRWSFVIYDLFLGLVSAGATVFAAWVLIEVLTFGYFLDVGVVAAPSIALLLGALLLLPCIVLLGFRAFTTKRSTLAIIYWFMVAVSALLALGLACWTLILRHQVMAGYLSSKIANFVLIENPKSLTDPETKHYWDALQTSMKCCGLNGAADYKSSGSLPMSCCDVVEHICSKTYSQGCASALTEFSAVKLAQIAIVASVAALCLFIGVYAGCSFSSSLRNEKKKNRENNTDVELEVVPLKPSTLIKSRPNSTISSLPRKKAPPPVPPKPSPRYLRSFSRNSEETEVMKVDPARNNSK
ncbi:leukocyte surface antigen CD53-like [Neocloeon triangulifer]|uniref:leukocyte surface antigen CD53-like n=1 Tax=Neocloeon triangulifer TaxID=2078957 RepID=UPI00286EE5D1|nr:leukocyte surface antigen CD53-like [Neocloeon triangulifer]